MDREGSAGLLSLGGDFLISLVTMGESRAGECQEHLDFRKTIFSASVEVRLNCEFFKDEFEEKKARGGKPVGWLF